jgi:elongation factor Ts
VLSVKNRNRWFEILEGAFVGSYVHVNKIAALTAISAAVPNAEVY